MCLASFNILPSDLVFDTLSDPAKSTRFNFDLQKVGDSFKCLKRF